VSGRNERTYEEMVQLDIEYAERRSLFLDLSILARTPFTVLARRGAA
jgi:lipopolysaccharide/colanic/teichoic acid biosynthesis glycosyltransferase